MEDNDMVGKNNMSYMCPQTCSLSCTQQRVHNLTRVETGSVNEANNMMKLSLQILLDISHIHKWERKWGRHPQLQYHHPP